MPNVEINGVNIEFPFDPYLCQKDYMTKVLDCLQKGENGILESPTGTGKTLCLLCASLGWLSVMKARKSMTKGITWTDYDTDNNEAAGPVTLLNQLEEATGTWDNSAALPKIIYASRTHSQLSQAMQELKRTAYNTFKACVIGSREQLCINPAVKKEQSNSAKVHMCRAKVTARTCHFYNTIDNCKSHFAEKVMDIEDLVKLGEKHKTCSYYMTRELKSDAEILFMPYNYLLDPKSRKAHNIELQGNIIIFDEAHNLERICEDSVSFDLTSHDLASAIEDVKELCVRVYNDEEMGVNNTDVAEIGGDNAIMPDFSSKECLELKTQLKKLEDYLDEIKVPEEGVTKPGDFIFELLAKIGITFQTKNCTQELIDKILSHMTSETSGFHRKGAGLTKVSEVLKIVFNREPVTDNKQTSHPYKVHIAAEDKNPKRKKEAADPWSAAASTETKKGRTLSYWCFSPGFSMDDLKSHGVKCIILTSGTLSPMDSFSKEMGIPFPIRLENPHVIEPHQTSIAVIKKGPDGTKLNSSYENRSDQKYQQSLGNAMVNFSRLVPNGVLVFFPSYFVMTTIIENWQQTNIWNRILQYKPIFIEPKGKMDFKQAMESFYEKINDPSLNGAIFMAVCRGKVSEGLDFADINGRAVIITGLPFPPRMDPKVVLKMKFLDENKQLSHRDGIQRLSGQEWYRQQATRAVNQAIGRVIRHKQDYGAMLLCDERFATKQSISQLPAWIRANVKVCEAFGSILRDLTGFFKKAESLLPQPQKIKKKKKTVCKEGYFMSSETYKSDAPKMPSSIIEEHVPSLINHKSKNTISDEMAEEDRLARLQIGYKTIPSITGRTQGKGLLNALDAHKSTFGPEQPCCSNDINNDLPKYEVALQKRMEDRKKAKKIVVVKKPGLSGYSSNIDDNFKTPSAQSQMTAASYSSRVKDSLTADNHKLFTSAMRDYTKTSDMTKLVVVLKKIFVDTNLPNLYKEFYSFVKPKDKCDFARVCKRLTGIDCGYKPEHSLSKRKLKSLSEESDGKRQKVDESQEGNSDTCLATGQHLDNQSQLNHGLISETGETTNIEQLRDDMHSKKYRCSKCENETNVPLQAPCNHICCLPCWREICEGSKTCPVCGLDVNKKNLIRPSCFDKNEYLAADDNDLMSKSVFNSESTDVCYKCKCDKPSLLRSSCNHVCCLSCWKEIFQSSSKCPVCGTIIKKRNLTRVKESDESGSHYSSQAEYVCAECNLNTQYALIAGCKHICCLPCWKIIYENSKKCPVCGLEVVKKNLRRCGKKDS